jgi:DNA-binding response OmpR family regulator
MAEETAGKPSWLVVEDESLIAMLVEETLIDAGMTVVGPVARVGKALDIAIKTELAGAVLDVNIAGEVVYPVADALEARGIPFLFLTGYGARAVRPDLRNHPILHKPFLPEQMRAIVESLTR